MVLIGISLWLLTLRLTGHPLFAEMAAMLREILAAMPTRRTPVAQP